LLCSGRITWDLMVERGKREDGSRFAIARVEQLYPAPNESIQAELAKFPGIKSIRWVQDEPANNGPWPYYALNVWDELGIKVERVTRDASSSPSVGVAKRHTEEQKDLLARAFA
jgi:2-oxoglutarate decarboxylase